MSKKKTTLSQTAGNTTSDSHESLTASVAGNHEAEDDASLAASSNDYSDHGDAEEQGYGYAGSARRSKSGSPLLVDGTTEAYDLPSTHSNRQPYDEAISTTDTSALLAALSAEPTHKPQSPFSGQHNTVSVQQARSASWSHEDFDTPPQSNTRLARRRPPAAAAAAAAAASNTALDSQQLHQSSNRVAKPYTNESIGLDNRSLLEYEIVSENGNVLSTFHMQSRSQHLYPTPPIPTEAAAASNGRDRRMEQHDLSRHETKEDDDIPAQKGAFQPFVNSATSASPRPSQFSNLSMFDTAKTAGLVSKAAGKFNPAMQPQPSNAAPTGEIGTVTTRTNEEGFVEFTCSDRSKFDAALAKLQQGNVGTIDKSTKIHTFYVDEKNKKLVDRYTELLVSPQKAVSTSATVQHDTTTTGAAAASSAAPKARATASSSVPGTSTREEKPEEGPSKSSSSSVSRTSNPSAEEHLYTTDQLIAAVRSAVPKPKGFFPVTAEQTVKNLKLIKNRDGKFRAPDTIALQTALGDMGVPATEVATKTTHVIATLKEIAASEAPGKPAPQQDIEHKNERGTAQPAQSTPQGDSTYSLEQIADALKKAGTEIAHTKLNKTSNMLLGRIGLIDALKNIGVKDESSTLPTTDQLKEALRLSGQLLDHNINPVATKALELLRAPKQVGGLLDFEETSVSINKPEAEAETITVDLRQNTGSFATKELGRAGGIALEEVVTTMSAHLSGEEAPEEDLKAQVRQLLTEQLSSDSRQTTASLTQEMVTDIAGKVLKVGEQTAAIGRNALQTLARESGHSVFQALQAKQQERQTQHAK